MMKLFLLAQTAQCHNNLPLGLTLLAKSSFCTFLHWQDFNMILLIERCLSVLCFSLTKFYTAKPCGFLAEFTRCLCSETPIDNCGLWCYLALNVWLGINTRHTASRKAVLYLQQTTRHQHMVKPLRDLSGSFHTHR